LLFLFGFDDDDELKDGVEYEGNDNGRCGVNKFGCTEEDDNDCSNVNVGEFCGCNVDDESFVNISE
jgi:hypothetical protein